MPKYTSVSCSYSLSSGRSAIDIVDGYTHPVEGVNAEGLSTKSMCADWRAKLALTRELDGKLLLPCMRCTSKASEYYMSANTAMPMFLTSCETEMHIWEIWLRGNCFC